MTDQQRASELAAVAPTTSSHVEPVNILLVDDEPRNLTVLKTVLDDPHYRLVCAESPEQALLALVVEEFALLIIDIQMPGMSGFELAQMVKQRQKTAGVPIIFLTAYYSEDRYVLEGYSTGAVDYLHKPINPTILRSKVAVFAELYRKSSELARANRGLQSEVAARRSAEEQLRSLNDELERRVAERTAELMRANTALSEADRRKDEFLATLAHELRNPLAPIRNSIEILRLAADNRAAVQTAQVTMRRQIEHMVRLIDDLLDVARITSGKITLRKKRVSLQELAETAAEASRPVIEAKGHALKLSLPREPILLDVDPTRVAQAFTNLLTNAAKYTPDGGSIELSALREAGELVVRVVDNGLGIPPGMLIEVFEMFTQVNRTLDRSQGGLGIGLALTRKMVELHGGTISAQSSGLGEGSTFTIRLPCVDPGAGQQEPGNAFNVATNHPPASTSARRVLVVDDSVDGAKSLMYLLQICGHETRVAYDGPEALEVAREFRPDVVFLDIGLPGMDGYEVLRRLRDEPFSSGALIVALTGWGSDQDKERSAQSGFDGHLTKPVEFATIQGLLDRLLPKP